MNTEKLNWTYNPNTHAVENSTDGRRTLVAFVAEDQPAALGERIASAPQMHRLATHLLDVFSRLNDKFIWTLRNGEDFARAVLEGNPHPEDMQGFAEVGFKTLPAEKTAPMDWHLDIAEKGGPRIRDASGKEVFTLVENTPAVAQLITSAAVTTKLAHFLLEEISTNTMQWLDQEGERTDKDRNFLRELNATRLYARRALDIPAGMAEGYSRANTINRAGMFVETNKEGLYTINFNTRLSGIPSAYGLNSAGQEIAYPTLSSVEEAALQIIERHKEIVAMDKEVAEEGELEHMAEVAQP